MRLSELGLREKTPHSSKIPKHKYTTLANAIEYLLECYEKKKPINVDGPTTLSMEPCPYKVAFMIIYFHIYRNKSFNDAEIFSKYVINNAGDKLIATSNMSNSIAFECCNELTTRDMLLIRRGEYLRPGSELFVN